MFSIIILYASVFVNSRLRKIFRILQVDFVSADGGRKRIGCRDGSGRGGSDEHCGGECDAEPVAAAFGAARSEPGGARCAPRSEQDGISPPEGRRPFCFTVG